MPHPNRPFYSAALAGSLSAVLLLGSGLSSSGWALSDAGLKLYSEGMQLLNTGKPEAALNRFESALSKSPDDVVLHQVLGETYSQLGQHQAALTHYRQITQLLPRDTGALLGMGHALEALGQYPQALDAYASILKLQPDYAYAHYAIAQAELKQQHWPMAISALERFLQTYPQHTEARRQLANAYKANGQPKKAIEVFEALSSDFPAQFTDALPLARAYNASNEPDKALKILLDSQSKVVDLSPEFQNELGYAYLSTGNVGFAKEAFVRALQQSPDNPATQLGLAQAYLKSQQADSAVPLFQQYLAQFPGDTVAQQQLGLAYVQSGQYNQAIAALTPLLSATPSTLSADDAYWITSHLALAHQSLETPEHLQQAIRLYEPLAPLATQKGDTTVLKNLALAYHQSGQLPQAVALYDTLLNQPDAANTDSLKGDAARAMVAAASDALVRNDTHTAQQWLQRAQELATHAEQTIPELSLLDANIQAALYHQQLANQPNPNAPTLAQAYASALTRYQAALAQWPNQPQVVADYVLLLLSPPTGQPSPEKVAHGAQLVAQAKTAATNNDTAALTPAPLLLAEATLAHLQQQPSQAIAAYQQFLHHPNLTLSNTDKAQHWVTLAQWQQANKQEKEALISYTQATQLDAQNEAAWTNLATLHAQQQRWADAKAAYQQALSANRTYPTALYGLAVTYDQLKETPQAIQHYSQYLASGDTQYADASRTRLAILAPNGLPQTPAPQTPSPQTLAPQTSSQPSSSQPVVTQTAPKPTNLQSFTPQQPLEFTVGNGANPMTIRLNVGEITVPANLAPAIPLQYDSESMDD